MRILIILAVLALSARAELKTETLLDALAMKETGAGWKGQPGPCGELSCWQITAAVWADEMPGVPFARARDYTLAHRCALRRIERIRRLTGDSVERIATCWHFGLSHRGRASVWGQEVANVYESLTR